MAKKKVIKKKASSKKVWFKTINSKHKWGFVPINWRGWIALLLLIGLNVFAANYFNLKILAFDNWSKFGVVFFLSIFIFIMIARRRTVNVKNKK